MIISNKNRHLVNDGDLDLHDAYFYSVETKLIDGKHTYTFKLKNEWPTEQEFIFVFSGVSSCVYLGENHSNILGTAINSWYSLPYCSYSGLSQNSLTKEEEDELNQHGIDKNNNIRKNIHVWEKNHDLNELDTEKLFRVVFFFSTPAFFEIECEQLLVERVVK